MLEILAQLLTEGNNEAIIALVTKLLARNSELELRLAQLLSRGKKNEGVSSAQLLLVFDALGSEGSEQLDKANEKLRAASGLDAKRDQDSEPRTREPKRQPRVRKPIPAHLRRVDNPISVPDDQRPCPQCGAERKCIGHDITEVVDLIPAEVIVRRDIREKLGCEHCDAELVRARWATRSWTAVDSARRWSHSYWSTSTPMGCRCIDRSSDLRGQASR